MAPSRHLSSVAKQRVSAVVASLRLREDWLQIQPLGFGPVRGKDTVMMLMVDGSVCEVSIKADLAAFFRQ